MREFIAKYYKKMFVPTHFKMTDADAIRRFIGENSFGILFSESTERPEATHLPFVFDASREEQGVLLGHFARANSHWKRLPSDKEVLVVFQGPHSYVSPSWYVSENLVPTWNYGVVHAYGRAKLIDDREGLVNILEALIHANESGFEKPWDIEQAADVLDKMLKAIIGLEIKITKIEAKLKLSQNQSKQDVLGAADVLEKSTNTMHQDVAHMMKMVAEQN